MIWNYRILLFSSFFFHSLNKWLLTRYNIYLINPGCSRIHNLYWFMFYLYTRVFQNTWYIVSCIYQGVSENIIYIDLMYIPGCSRKHNIYWSMYIPGCSKMRVTILKIVEVRWRTRYYGWWCCRNLFSVSATITSGQ